MSNSTDLDSKLREYHSTRAHDYPNCPSMEDLRTAADLALSDERGAIVAWIRSTLDWDGGPPLANMIAKMVDEGIHREALCTRGGSTV